MNAGNCAAYEFQLSCRTVFGRGCIDSLGRQVRSLGTAPPGELMLVLCRDSAWCEEPGGRIRASLAQAGDEREPRLQVYDRVIPNPTLGCVREGVALYRRWGAEGIISLGGGSALDAGKAIATEAGARLLVSVPTTAGSGSEASPWAVIEDVRSRRKLSLRCRTPDLALLDPELTMSMPERLTLFTGIDAFAHALEAYLSPRACAVTDALALSAVRLIGESLPVVLGRPRDLGGRAGMLEASFLAGAAMMHCGLGLIHAIANTMGGYYPRLVHGQVVAHLLGPVARFNRRACGARLARVAGSLRGVQDVCEREYARLGLGRLSVREEDIPELASRSAENLNSRTNPREFTGEDIRALLRESFLVVHDRERR
ncbi:MAG: iron-containing alcohol dehydrogenase family protein [Spirochaetota bacterium]